MKEWQRVCPHSFVLSPHCPSQQMLSAKSLPSIIQVKQVTLVIPPVKPHSAPGVAAVLDVVVLEVALIFDLVDQDLGQEDANQLG